MPELYAAGALSPAEREELEQAAAAYPEVRAALNEACAAMESYAQSYAVTPKADLKQRIMQQVEEAALEKEALEASVHPLYAEREASSYKWMFAASLALFLISGALSLYFYSRWQQAENSLALAVAQEQQYAQQFNTVSERVQQQEQVLQVLRDQNFMPVRLEGVEQHPGTAVTVYWNASAQAVYVDNVQLPKPPSGKQYQLWALLDGKPIDAGMLQVNGSDALQQMKAIRAAQAFAITLEPEGGSENPTLEQLYVMGEVQS